MTASSLSPPSVVVVRSSCLPSLEVEEEQDTHHTTRAAVENDDDDVASLVLQRTLHALPVTCNVVVLPEIPHDDGDGMGTGMMQEERQALHACGGMENVLLLHNLPPSSDPADTYLLSFTSCEMLITQIETTRGRHGHGGAAVPLHVDPPMVVPVQAIPSTFSFDFETKATIPSSSSSSFQSQHGSSIDNNGVVVNPRSASAKLNVVFDFSRTALKRLEETVIEHQQNDETNVPTNESNNSNVSSFVVEEISAQPLSLDGSNVAHHDTTNGQATFRQEHDHSHRHHHQEELIHVIRALAEKEAMHLDYMLAGLAFVFVLLLVHYARTVVPVIRNKTAANKKKRHKVSLSAGPSQSLVSETTALVADRTSTEKQHNNATHRPPVNSVTFHRSSCSGVGTKDVSTAALQQSHETDKAVVVACNSPSSKTTPFVTSESTIGMMAETSSLSSSSARDIKQFTFLPTDYSLPKKAKENTSPNDAEYRQLSPCSKLAQHWMQAKEKRREGRKDNLRPHDVISPVAEIPSPMLAPEEERIPTPSTTTLNHHLAIPRLSFCGPNKLIRDYIADDHETLPHPVFFHEAKVSTPETCHMREESFLQDYWGE